LEGNNQKPFWRYIYSQGNDRAGVAPLKDGGELFSGSKDKAEILNRQFSSVFTADCPGSSVQLIGPSVPIIDNLSISAAGVQKLLSKINPSKAAGPDDMPCRVLKELSHELAPVLAAIYTQSFASGCLPSQWLTANISPVFKNGMSCLPENYRPISLTCICCKIMEHIVCSHIREHLDKYGFRASHSCETQLLTTLHDILSSRDRNIQIDAAVLDFSKAFDKVPHKGLMSKLQLYGIQGNVFEWIRAFLSNRTQRVLVEEVMSS